mgnify:CR=1 FL=1
MNFLLIFSEIRKSPEEKISPEKKINRTGEENYDKKRI